VLVLSRRVGEKIVLPGLGITVQILSIKGNVVRLGIAAPADVKVFREELLRPPPKPVKT
jgi:carbon storage regulator